MTELESRPFAWDGVLITLIVLFAVSLSLNVCLGVSLRSRDASLRSYERLNSEHATLIKPAEAIIGGKPALSRLRDANGDAASLTPSKNLVLYYFSPSCVWCMRNLESVRYLAGAVGPKYEVVGFVRSADGLKSYLAVHSLPFRVVVDSDPDDASALGLIGTPQTIVLTNGIVTQNWMGAYMGDVKNSIQSFFRTTLPDFPK